ncbi:hypothetical protein HKX48_009382 [Thoreauomyces humboldtii]|nr:hypothetical protein HKX48_009382 [Thoreauomyces humboldtii]
MLELAPEGFVYPTDSKSTLYSLLASQATALLDPSLPRTSNLANLSSLLYHALRDPPLSRHINWVGFYLFAEDDDDEKVMHLGPFQGRVACTSIPVGKGVCGAAARDGKTYVVGDVLSWKGHIACDSRSRSEIVVPVLIDGKVVGVLDVDCEIVDGLDEEDAVGFRALVDVVVKNWSSRRR